MNIAINKLIINNQENDYINNKKEFELFTKTFCKETNLSNIIDYNNYYSLFYLSSNVEYFNFSNKAQPIKPLNIQNINQTKQPAFQIKLDDKKSSINTTKMNINLRLMQIHKNDVQEENINKDEFSKIYSEILPSLF